MKMETTASRREQRTVELRIGQRIDQPLDRRNRLEMPGRVEHQAAVREPRLVTDRPRRMPQRVVPEFKVESHELAEGFEAAESAEDGGRVEGRLAPAARDAQRVGLVRLQLREILRPSTNQVESSG